MSRNRSRSRLSASVRDTFPSPLRSCSRMRCCAMSAGLLPLPKDELDRESRPELLDRESRLDPLELLKPNGELEPEPNGELETEEELLP